MKYNEAETSHLMTEVDGSSPDDLENILSNNRQKPGTETWMFQALNVVWMWDRSTDKEKDTYRKSFPFLK